MTPNLTEIARIGLLDGETLGRLMWFDLGDEPSPPHAVNTYDALATTPLPFDHVGVLEKRSDGALVMVVTYQDGNVIAVVAYVLHQGWHESVRNFTLIRTDRGLRYKLLEEEEANFSDLERHAVGGVVRTLERFMRGVHPAAYKAEPKVNSLINKKRIAKGKPPLQYDWHTVAVKPAQPKSEPKGGTHASPRLHDRRGHWRTYKSGNRVWVKSCKVGDGIKGSVFKDYKISQESK